MLPRDELDLATKVWTIPAERMKGKREHRVPLAPRAVALVKEMAATRLNDYVFPGFKRGEPLSDEARGTFCGTCTVHGFRSTFKGWSAR
jgi:integrase